MSEIGIIANPHSKLNKRNPERTGLLSYILGEKGEFALTQSLDDLALVAKKFKEKGIKILAINGGDGTVARTLTAFIQEYGSQPMPKIALLRGGTINMLASNLGIRGNPEQVLYRLLRTYSQPGDAPEIRLSCLKVDGHYGFLFGNGLVSAFLTKFYQNKTGPLGSILLIGRVMLSAALGRTTAKQLFVDHSLKLRFDNGPQIPISSVALLVATIKRMPFGPKFFPQIRYPSDFFQAVVMRVAARHAPFILPLNAITSPGSDDYAKISYKGTKLQIESDTMIDYTVDGEIFPVQNRLVTIELGPKLDFIIP